MIQLLWRPVWRVIKKPETKLPYDPTIPLLGIHPEKIIIKKDTCIPVLIGARFTIAKTWKQPRCLLTDEWIGKLYYICTMKSVVC